MARYQVILAYDGTDFHGFQRQAQESHTRTVQDEFEIGLRKIGWRDQSILAAGRTDTGVHASGQVVAFDLDWQHSLSDLRAALNANLPFDMAVKAARRIRADFHPRYDAEARCYQYRIYQQSVRDPFRERYAWRVWPAVDLEILHQAAELLPGSHDFRAFGAPPKPGGKTVRRVFRAEWRQSSKGLIFEILANAFLYHMVRRLVSFQVTIGQGKLEVGAIRECLQTAPQTLIRGLAPPQGLTLVEVIYSERDSDIEISGDQVVDKIGE